MYDYEKSVGIDAGPDGFFMKSQGQIVSGADKNIAFGTLQNFAVSAEGSIQQTGKGGCSSSSPGEMKIDAKSISLNSGSAAETKVELEPWKTKYAKSSARGVCSV